MGGRFLRSYSIILSVIYISYFLNEKFYFCARGRRLLVGPVGWGRFPACLDFTKSKDLEG